MHHDETFERGDGPARLGRRCAMVGARVAPLLGMMALASVAARVASRAETHSHRHCCDRDHPGYDRDREGPEESRRGEDRRRFRTEACERCGHHRHWD